MAAAMRDSGDKAGATKLLERHARLTPAAAISGGWSYSDAFEWMRLRADLAQLYRDEHRENDARTIELGLLKLLTYADKDFPLSVQLKQRVAR
jgi:hypothetical protein